MLYEFPKGYRRNDDKMLPAYLRGYIHFFYANLDETIDDTDFDNWRLSLFDRFGNETASNVGTLIKDLIVGSNFRFYANFTIPVGVNPGEYQLVIYNTVDSTVKYQSNPVQVITDSQVEDFVLLFFRHSTNSFNFNYQGFSNYNTVFLPMNVIEEQPEITLNQSRELSTGVIRNQKNQVSKVVQLESFFFDDGANNMMLALSAHDDIQINGQTMVVKTAYQIETDLIDSVQKGIIELYDQSFSTINLNS